MRYAKAGFAALVAFVGAFGVSIQDGHTWPVAVGLGVTAAITSAIGVYQIPYVPAK